jgi:NADH-quinone oxidoreductase subunit J
MVVTTELIVFFVLAAVSIGAAIGMLTSRNAVHSALFLVLNFAVVSVFFLLLSAPFIAMVQITVYAGAIMVLFLFVIMLLGAEMLRRGGTVLRWQPALAAVLSLVFVGVLGFVIVYNSNDPNYLSNISNIAVIENDFGGPQAIGQTLFNNYLLPFELTSFLLLVAMIGAVVLTRDSLTRARERRRGAGPAPSNPPA